MHYVRWGAWYDDDIKYWSFALFNHSACQYLLYITGHSCHTTVICLISGPWHCQCVTQTCQFSLSSNSRITVWKHMSAYIGHVNNVPTMQCFTRISRYSHSELYMISLTECVRKSQNNAHQQALLQTVQRISLIPAVITLTYEALKWIHERVAWAVKIRCIF